MHQVHLNERTFCYQQKKVLSKGISAVDYSVTWDTGLTKPLRPRGQSALDFPLRMTVVVHTYKGGKDKATDRALGDERGCIQSEPFGQALVAITRHRDPTTYQHGRKR
jgi:hypothetical protein